MISIVDLEASDWHRAVFIYKTVICYKIELYRNTKNLRFGIDLCRLFLPWSIIFIWNQRQWSSLSTFKLYNLGHTKGQLISKYIFGIFNSPKKQTKKFDSTTMVPQVDLFSFISWKNLKTLKKHFEINWPLPIFVLWV